MFGFSVLTVLDEATLPAILYVNGKLIEASPLSYPEDTYFPEPIGTIKTYAIIHSELATLPYTIPGVKTVTYKDSWDESVFPILDFLRGIGLTSDEEIEINGCKISPKKLLAMLAKPGEPRDIFGCLRVELIGYIGGLKGRLVYFLGPVGYNDDWNVGVTAYTTGIGASIGAQLLGEGYFTEKGVIPPEKISEPGEWIRRLVDRGMNITEVKSDIENIK
jgi:lysine 6-dehydrogenase